MVLFFYSITTGCIFDISLCENSINRKSNSTTDSDSAILERDPEEPKIQENKCPVPSPSETCGFRVCVDGGLFGGCKAGLAIES